jgi:hypothetical protein
MPRTKPKTGWKSETSPTLPELTDEQRLRIERCGLRVVALGAVENIMREALAQASEALPTQAEVGAALKELQRKIRSAQTALAACDEWTAKHIDLAHYRLLQSTGQTTRIPPPKLDIMEPATDCLIELDAAIEKAKELIEQQIKPMPTTLEKSIARKLRDTFHVFHIPFSRSKKSPAVRTLCAVLSITPDAAEHHIREIEASGE